jgi:hypothetical protein
MWINRGERQLMKPLNAAIELSDGLPVAEADYRNKDWPKDYPTGLKRIGYEINQADLPVFKYQMGNQTITDQLEPAEQGNSLIRRFEKEGNTELILQLAQGQEIAQLDSGLYCIDGQYYLEIIGNSDAYVHDGQSLRAVLGDTPLSYQIIW